ncbi:MAG: DUF4340 domain-containing protein [Anaerolineales bacterium]|nr:DUF4340 domain-containing protein [Anaerolineales bacterium]
MAGKTTSTKKTPTRAAAPAKAAKTKVKAVATRKESSIIKQERPLFRAGTWITILVLAVLIGFTFYINREQDPATLVVDETPVSAPVVMFAATEGIPASIEVKPAEGGETVRIARNAENVWAVELPIEAEANQGLAEAAASQISALRILSPIENGKPSIFGLENPAFTITIVFDGGKTHTLEIGDSTPTNSGYYVRIDKDQMAITDLSGIDSLLQLGFFPPYLNTPTPTPLPATETPVPATEAESTPEVPVTPTP